AARARAGQREPALARAGARCRDAGPAGRRPAMNARAEPFLADAAAASATPLELRVLEGEQRGAHAPVAWRSFEIGGLHAGAGCEVQLRDEQIGHTRVRVTPRRSTAARLEVVAGE